MENFFDQAHTVAREEVPYLFHKETDKKHGRIEIRELHVIEDFDGLPNACK